MSGNLVGYLSPTAHLRLPRLGRGWTRLVGWARRRRETVCVVRVPEFTDIPPT